jgi:predicted nucleotidyltransferase component of viral defense system
MRKINHPYSDKLPEQSLMIPCYDLKEVVSEKLRALVQRSYSAPRDYYDIFYLKNLLNENDWKMIKEAFWKKMEFKNLKNENVESLINDDTIKIIEGAWISSLRRQISEEKLPDVKTVIQTLKKLG